MQSPQKIPVDLMPTKRDPQTGLVIEDNPYKLRVIKNGEGRIHLWEQPKGSGNLKYKDGLPAGRYVDGKWAKDAAHVPFTIPETADKKFARELMSKDVLLSEKDAQLKKLQQEIAAIQAEKNKK